MLAQAKADALLAAIEGAGGDEMRNQKALVDQMRKVSVVRSPLQQLNGCRTAVTCT